MAKRRQVVLSCPASDGGAVTAELLPLGALREVEEIFARFNTARDGSPLRSSMVILHGPGMVVEVPAFDEQRVTQAMVSVNDEDLAFCVLWRLCRQHGWKMTDPETGQTFG